MSKKEELEYVLGARIHDEHVDFIKNYYSAFYQEPAKYKGDGLVDIILADLNVTPAKTPLESAALSKGINLKHQDTFGTIAWGTYNDQPVYVVVATGSHVEALRSYDTDMQIKDGKPEDLVATVAFSDDGKSALVFVQTIETIHTIGELPFTICQVPGYTKGFMRRMFLEGEYNVLESYYVPFVNVGAGRNPVLWRVHTDVSDPNEDTVLFNTLSAKVDLYDGLYEEDFKSARLNLENQYPGVDLEVNESGRYVLLAGQSGKLVFNQNAIPGKSNIHTQNMLLPWALDITERVPDIETNLYEIIGGLAEWSSLYFKVATDAAGPVNENKETARDFLAAKHPEAANGSAYSSGFQGRQLGQSQATTRLGKLLDNASGSYEQQNVD